MLELLLLISNTETLPYISECLLGLKELSLHIFPRLLYPFQIDFLPLKVTEQQNQEQISGLTVLYSNQKTHLSLE